MFCDPDAEISNHILKASDTFGKLNKCLWSTPQNFSEYKAKGLLYMCVYSTSLCFRDVGGLPQANEKA